MREGGGALRWIRTSKRDLRFAYSTQRRPFVPGIGEKGYLYQVKHWVVNIPSLDSSQQLRPGQMSEGGGFL